MYRSYQNPSKIHRLLYRKIRGIMQGSTLSYRWSNQRSAFGSRGVKGTSKTPRSQYKYFTQHSKIEIQILLILYSSNKRANHPISLHHHPTLLENAPQPPSSHKTVGGVSVTSLKIFFNLIYILTKRGGPVKLRRVVDGSTGC